MTSRPIKPVFTKDHLADQAPTFSVTSQEEKLRRQKLSENIDRLIDENFEVLKQLPDD